MNTSFRRDIPFNLFETGWLINRIILCALAVVLFSLAAMAADKKASPTPDFLVKKSIGGASVEEWFETARDWIRLKNFTNDVERFGTQLISVLMECFDEEWMEAKILEPDAEKKKSQIAYAQYSAMCCFHALGQRGAVALPRILEKLKNRELKSRATLANAIVEMGPVTTNAIPIALEDLKSDSEVTQQQGVILLSASARFSDLAMNQLIESADHVSQRVRYTAFYLLFKLRDASEKARAALEKIEKDPARSDDASYIRRMQRFSKDATLGGMRPRVAQ